MSNKDKLYNTIVLISKSLYKILVFLMILNIFTKEYIIDDSIYFGIFICGIFLSIWSSLPYNLTENKDE